MSIEKVKEYFAEYGREDDILEFDQSSATVELAAQAANVIPARIATHADLLDFIRKGDEKGYRDAIERHFEVYKIFKVNRSLELMAEKNEE